jgi:outer membrane protein assembly factor BamB
MADVIHAGAGNDVIDGQGGKDLICGGRGSDDIAAGDGHDEVAGQRGDDIVRGQGWYDVLRGGSGSDVLVGSSGFDRLFGGSGSDDLYGGADSDVVDGGAGSDNIDGGSSSDLLLYDRGGPVEVDLHAGVARRGEERDLLSGFEHVTTSAWADRIVASPGDGTIRAGAGDDVIVGQAGDDYILAGDGDDDVSAGGGDDDVFGEGGDDVLRGEGGADSLLGADGVDAVNGSIGSDWCAGDTFASCEGLYAEFIPPPPEPKLAPVALPEATSNLVTPLPSRAFETFQMDAAHTGGYDDGLRDVAPMAAAWSAEVGGQPSYPLIADDRVFTVVDESNGAVENETFGTDVVALDLATGAELWRQRFTGHFWTATLSYHDGLLIAAEPDGHTAAFDAATGNVHWETDIGSRPGILSMLDGRIYGFLNQSLTVHDASTGGQVWRRQSGGNSYASPSVAGDAVFTTNDCGVTRWDRSSGEHLWSVSSSGCLVGGIFTGSIHQGLVYTRDTDRHFVVRAEDGVPIAQHDGALTPAFTATQGFFVDDEGDLVARNVDDLAPLWTFSAPAPVAVPPLVSNGTVFIATIAGDVYGLRAADGVPVWSSNVGEPIVPIAEYGPRHPTAAMAAGESALVIPSQNKLTAFTRAD